MSRRENAQFALTYGTCYLGLFSTISLLSGNWAYLLFGLVMALIMAPLMFLVGYGIYRLYGWLLRVDS